ncbi:MAG: Gfo/Idh/MocA family protein [Christensenellales bacterium]|jgi:UDP-N-acetyl-2-amino-2-deoxyglucuronate dehydrogenase
MPDTLNAAIVGCGSIASVHAALIGSMDGVRLAACADIAEDRAVRLADKYNAAAYRSLEDMLAHEAIDVLHICTPHALHVPMAVEAAARGIKVFTEKPPVISREQWARFSALNSSVGICFQNRYNKNIRHVKQLLDTGAVGRVTGARAVVAWYRDAPYYQNSGWRGTWALEGGGVLINQAIHTLDLLVMLLGPHTGVDTYMANRQLQGVIEVEDTVDARIAFGDAVGLFTATNAYSTSAPVQIRIDCEQAALTVEDNRLAIFWRSGRIERIAFEQPDALGKDYWGSGHAACIADYYRAMKQSEPAPIGIREVEATVMLMLDMYDQGRRWLK